MRLLLKSLVVGALLVLLGVVIARVQPWWGVPVHRGTSQGYWAAAARVRSESSVGGPSWGLTNPIDGWYLYSNDHMHGSDFFRVPESEVLTDFPRSAEQLGGEDNVVPEWAQTGFRTWEQADPQRSDAHSLILHLRMARLNWWMRNRPEYLADQLENDVNLGIAWQRMALFPLLRLAEWAYLSALIVFAAWPWLRNRGRWAWAFHAAPLPLLLLLPYYLGYCQWNFTSAGPGGGVIYPSILNAFRSLSWTSFDTAMIRRVPQPLAPLAGPLGPVLSLSGGTRAGPSDAVRLGLFLGATVFGLHWLSGRVRRSLEQSLPRYWSLIWNRRA